MWELWVSWWNKQHHKTHSRKSNQKEYVTRSKLIKLNSIIIIGHMGLYFFSIFSRQLEVCKINNHHQTAHLQYTLYSIILRYKYEIVTLSVMASLQVKRENKSPNIQEIVNIAIASLRSSIHQGTPYCTLVEVW